MNAMRLFLRLWIAAVLFGLSCHASAEDVDIYSGDSTGALPNILIVIDSGANFASDAKANCTYADGTAPTLNSTSGKGTAGSIEQCALVDTINALPDAGTVNIGLMSYNANNIASGAAAGVATTCSGGTSASGNNGTGGCLLMPLTLMNAANKAKFVSFIKSWKSSGSSDATTFNIKTANEATGAAVQEAWAYYNGKVGISGTNYATSIVDGGCQKNFMIFIGNALESSGTPGDGSGAAYPANETTGLNSAQAAATAAQKTKLSNTVHFDSTTCKVTSVVAGTNISDWSENWADEWSRLMYQQDASATRDGIQRIITYGIGVIDQDKCKPDYSALLKNMADYGGGKYFRSEGSASDIKNAILMILNEVQAVNSVFASSSLPVSVNAQGTYLNQIYMGMFRPDTKANPRWVGNLKQYAFIVNPDGSLALGDALGHTALSSSGTGFLSPNAISYWTCSNASNAYLNSLTTAQRALLGCPSDNDPSGGFWLNAPAYVQSAGGFYDLPDGEVVEKGGVAQRLRLAYLDVTAATYTSTGGPRKLVTYCPTGSSCNADLANSANAFTSGNADITASMFGASTRYKVLSIVRTGTNAVVTTLGNHGFTTGNMVTIENATSQAYNVTQAVTVLSPTTFRITGLPDYPTTPSQGTYTVAVHNSSGITVSSIARTSSSTATGTNSETATATTATIHGYGVGTVVSITGATPADFSGQKTVTNPGTYTFDFPVTIYPTTPAANAYSVSYHPGVSLGIQSITGGSSATVTTTVAHGYAAGEIVNLANTGQAKYDGNRTVVSVPTPTTFRFDTTGNPGNVGAGVATVTRLNSGTPVAITNLTRTGTGATAIATATVGTGFVNNAQVDIVKTGGGSTFESAYVGTVTINCSSPCTTFNYPIPVTPGLSASGSMNVSAISAGPMVVVPAGSITRSGTTATVSGLSPGVFANGRFVDIAVSGTAYPNEAAYTAAPSTGWPITCPDSFCTSFTFGPVTQFPESPAAGAQITAYSASTPPDKTTLINWVRGQDNFGDETGPGGSITIRPSLHGDVLHSRPLVLNYGDKGVVVFYGDNGGVFHAVNGNKANFAGKTPAAWGSAGSEIWGFVPPEVFPKLSRQRINDPDMLLPTTPEGILPAPQKKDYFVDGATGVYQLVNHTTGAIEKAVIYLTLRRGGGVIYAIDVTDPASPQVLWRADNSSPGMAELGQTWSLPQVARVNGRPAANPVVIFGAGYDTSEDSEPTSVADTMGRGIYILDALTGGLVWSATYGTTKTCLSTGTVTATTGSVACQDPNLRYAIPSDIALMDKNSDGYIDRLYVGDLGGNLWRVDLEPLGLPALADTWQINRIASLGCDSADCPLASGPSPRKIFFPPEIISTSGYDALFVVTGDREHPTITATESKNRVFMLQDQHTGNNVLADPAQNLIRPNALVNQTDCSSAVVKAPCTTTTAWVPYAGESPGYYIKLAPGENGVNAPLVVAGSVYFGTNRPTPADPDRCNTNLGEARSYRLMPFSGRYGYTVFDGGGLPPSPVAGVVQIEEPVIGDNGETITTTKNVAFGIGLGAGHTTPGGEDMDKKPCVGTDCSSALGGREPPIEVSTSRTRTYWYIEGK